MSTSESLETFFPPFRLRIRAGDLTLRAMTDADLPAYASLVRGPIFEDPSADHVFPWYQAAPEQRGRDAVTFQWVQRSQVSPERWCLPLGVFVGERLIGSQDVSAKLFAQRRTVTSGSWLTLEEHGKGYRRLMRQAMLIFAFDHLGAVRAESSAGLGNTASIGVSRSCGYRDNGTHISEQPGTTVTEQRFVITPEDLRRPAEDVEVTGLDQELRELLGA